jgi:peptidoglycan/xylan/chitin deacetylase (PgdA/CDA1 family)
MIIAKIPRILSRTFKSLTWDLPVKDKVVYLTFDDGPTPKVTDWVLDLLDENKAKATFFCLGNNVASHAEIYKRILAKGHSVGNHSYSHLKGFRTSSNSYVEDVDRAAEIIDSTLFRPPYGRLWPSQVRKLRKKYRIIMWSVLSVDYNSNVDSRQVIRNVTDNVRPGSIIVFHDSLKASKNLYKSLPEVLAFLIGEGYQMKSISDEELFD